MVLSTARRFSIFAILIATLSLVGCNEKENEPEARKAFIQFLKQDVLAKNGYKLPPLGSKEKKAFGRYVAHYEILVDSRRSVTELYSKYFYNGKVLTSGYSLTNLQSLQSSWRAIITTRAGMDNFTKNLEAIAQETNRDIAALKQPEDLRIIYNQVLAEKVLKPIEIGKKLATRVDKKLQALTEIGKFLDENRNKLSLSSYEAKTKDPTAQAKMEVLEEKFDRELTPMLKVIDESKKALSD